MTRKIYASGFYHNPNIRYNKDICYMRFYNTYITNIYYCINRTEPNSNNRSYWIDKVTELANDAVNSFLFIKLNKDFSNIKEKEQYRYIDNFPMQSLYKILFEYNHIDEIKNLINDLNFDLLLT